MSSRETMSPRFLDEQTQQRQRLLLQRHSDAPAAQLSAPQVEFEHPKSRRFFFANSRSSVVRFIPTTDPLRNCLIARDVIVEDLYAPLAAISIV